MHVMNMGLRLRDFICERKITIVDLIFLSFLAYLPLLSTGFTGIWNKTDLDYHLYPIETFLNQLYLWDHYLFTGWDITPTHALITLDTAGIWAFLRFIGLSIGMVERVHYFLIFALMGYGMYYLMGTLFYRKEETAKRIARLTASTLYIFNPYIILLINGGLLPYLEAQAFLPITFAFLVNGLRASISGNWVKYAILTGIASSFMLSTHYSLAFLSVLFFGFYLLTNLLLDLLKHEFKKFANHIKFVLFTFLMSIFFNSWWLFPFLYRVYTGELFSWFIAGSQAFLIESGLLQWQVEQFSRGFLHVPRLELMINRPKFAPSYWESWISAPSFISLGLFLYVLTLLPLFFLRRNKHILFFTLLSTIFFGIMGTVPLFAFIMSWLYQQIPYFQVISYPMKYAYIAVLAYSVLLGVSVAEIGKRLSLARARTFAVSFWTRGFAVSDVLLRRSLTVSVILLILLNSYPMMTLGLDGPLQPMHIPSYYEEAREWINSQEGDFRILPLPRMAQLEKYTWSPNYDGSSILPHVFTKPILEERPFWEQNSPQVRLVKDLVWRRIERNDVSYASKLLNLLNVKYILLREDLMEPAIGEKWQPINVSNLRSILEQWKELVHVKSFGSLHFYENLNYENIQVYATVLNFYTQTMSIRNFFTSYPDINVSNVTFIWSETLSRTDKEFLENQGSLLNLPPLPVNYQSICSFDDVRPKSFLIKPIDGDLIVDSVDFKESNGSLVVMPYEGTSQWAGLSINFESPQDWQGIVLISFWFKISSLDFDFLEFYIQDDARPSNNWIWRFKDQIKEPNTWHRVKLNFWESPSAGPIDVSKIIYLRVVMKKSGKVATSPSFKIDDLMIGTEPDSVNPESEIIVKTKKPTLTYEKINPVRYDVQVDAEDPFTLVFLETYSSGWKARIKSDDTELKHIIANFYANGWLVNKTGKYTIVIEYTRQIYYTIGKLISIASGFLALILLYYIKKRQKYFIG